MPNSNKILLLTLLTAIAAICMFFVKPIAQNVLYHQFADSRTYAGIPNFANVISNLPFIIIGAYGITTLQHAAAPANIKLMYAVLFFGIFITGLGSAYYHLNPNNNTLVWDRIPMTIVFMAFLSCTIAGFINIKAGTLLLLPLLLLGIGSVFYWQYTEQAGAGDLRLYGFVQFYPALFIPLIMVLFKNRAQSNTMPLLVWLVVWYVIAKLFEHFDVQVYNATGFISGHTLKHLAAALSTLCIVKFSARKYVLH